MKGSEMSKVGAVVVAAGRGARMGTERNKVYLELLGQPILLHTLTALLAGGRLAELVLVTRPEDQREAELLLARANTSNCRVSVVGGGAERFDSVRNGVAGLGDELDVILIHDAARPFIPDRLMKQVIRAALDSGAALPVLPVTDTLKQIVDQRVVGTIDRGGLARAQTPQGFRADLLREALAQPLPDGFSPTDDVALVERLGRPVAAVAGAPFNLKITTPEDLVLARAILHEQHSATAGPREPE